MNHLVRKADAWHSYALLPPIAENNERVMPTPEWSYSETSAVLNSFKHFTIEELTFNHTPGYVSNVA